MKKFSVNMIDFKISMTRKRLTLNILERMDKIGIGTNELEVFSRRYHCGGGRVIKDHVTVKRIVKLVMVSLSSTQVKRVMAFICLARKTVLSPTGLPLPWV